MGTETFFQDLTISQRNRVVDILHEIYRLADAVDPEQSDNNVASVNRTKFNFFTIDGQRGSGKSTLVNSVQQIARYLGDSHQGKSASDQEILKILSAENLLTQHYANNGSRSAMRTAHVVPTIRPEMFQDDETELPDYLFDVIRDDLEKLRERKQNGIYWRTPLEHDDRDEAFDAVYSRDQLRSVLSIEKNEEITALLAELRDKIDPAWSYARKLGREVLSQDAINFNEYVAEKGRLSSLATRRHIHWHNFLSKYLNLIGARMLIVPVDDCDLSPNVAQHLMSDLRLYLAHERVAVVMAMDLGALQRLLEQNRYRSLGDMTRISEIASRVLRVDDDKGKGVGASPSRHIISDYFERVVEEKREVVDQISKILPLTRRYHIRTPDLGEIDHVLLGHHQVYKNTISSTPTKDASAGKSRRIAAANVITQANKLIATHLESNPAWKARDQVLSPGSQANRSFQASTDLFFWRSRYLSSFNCLRMRDLAEIREQITRTRDQEGHYDWLISQYLGYTPTSEYMSRGNFMRRVRDFREGRLSSMLAMMRYDKGNYQTNLIDSGLSSVNRSADYSVKGYDDAFDRIESEDIYVMEEREAARNLQSQLSLYALDCALWRIRVEGGDIECVVNGIRDEFLVSEVATQSLQSLPSKLSDFASAFSSGINPTGADVTDLDTFVPLNALGLSDVMVIADAFPSTIFLDRKSPEPLKEFCAEIDDSAGTRLAERLEEMFGGAQLTALKESISNAFEMAHPGANELLRNLQRAARFNRDWIPKLLLCAFICREVKDGKKPSALNGAKTTTTAANFIKEAIADNKAGREIKALKHVQHYLLRECTVHYTTNAAHKKLQFALRIAFNACSIDRSVDVLQRELKLDHTARKDRLDAFQDMLDELRPRQDVRDRVTLAAAILDAAVLVYERDDLLDQIDQSVSNGDDQIGQSPSSSETPGVLSRLNAFLSLGGSDAQILKLSPWVCPNVDKGDTASDDGKLNVVDLVSLHAGLVDFCSAGVDGEFDQKTLANMPASFQVMLDPDKAEQVKVLTEEHGFSKGFAVELLGPKPSAD